MDYDEFAHKIEQIASDTVADCHPVDWDEDFITRTLLNNFRQDLRSTTVHHGRHKKSNIKWRAFKLTGKPERKFGDIAIIVRIRHRDGRELEGVGFLEAKKRDNDSFQFRSIKKKQFQMISRHAPHAFVLLYDYTEITGLNRCDLPFASSRYWNRYWEDIPFTQAVVVPMGLALESALKDIRIYRYCMPLSYQLPFRYFQGYDLEFDKKALSIAKGYELQKFGGPSYLLMVSIGVNVEEGGFPKFAADSFSELE